MLTRARRLAIPLVTSGLITGGALLNTQNVAKASLDTTLGGVHGITTTGVACENGQIAELGRSLTDSFDFDKNLDALNNAAEATGLPAAEQREAARACAAQPNHNGFIDTTGVL